MRASRPVLAMAALAAGWASDVRAQTYTLRVLPRVDRAFDINLAHALHEGGPVVGQAYQLGGETRYACFWTDRHPEIISIPSGHPATATDVDGKGTIVGSITDTSAFPATMAGWAFREGSLEFLPPPAGANFWEPTGIADGMVVGYAATSQGPAIGDFKGCLWSRTAAGWNVSTLAPLSPGEWTMALAISESGLVVGRAGDSSGKLRACLWSEEGVPSDLGTLGGSEASASDINSRGEVLGNSLLRGDQVWRAFLHDGHRMHNLGIPPGFNYIHAFGLNDRREITVSARESEYSPAESFLWRNGAMHNLNRLTRPVSGFVLTAAGDIDNEGRIVAGVKNSIEYLGAVLIPCDADCDSDFYLTVADFGCFQSRFVAADPWADCDRAGGLTVADFGCFQAKFVAGCP